MDESKSRGYLLVAAALSPAEVGAARRVLRALVLPGQRRLHMKDESEPRKRSIIAVVAATGARVVVYDAGRRYRTERDRRRACLNAVVAGAATAREVVLVLEEDDTLAEWDRRTLYGLTRAHRCERVLAYQHQRAAAELLLAVPDAVAWCWAKGGDWRRRVEPLVEGVHQV